MTHNSADIRNYIARYLEMDVPRAGTPSVDQLELSTESFESGVLSTERPNLAGFRVDHERSFPDDGKAYLATPVGPNIYEMDCHLVSYWNAGKKTAIASGPMPDEKSILASCSVAERTHLRLALQVMGASAVTFFNSPNVAIVEVQEAAGDLSVQLGFTSYFTNSLTNDMFAKQLLDRRTKTLIYDFIQRYPARLNDAGTWEFLTINECVGVSNHVGSAVLAISADGYPIIQQQSAAAQNHGGRIHVSGAGSLELADLEFVQAADRQATFEDFLKFGMARELLEETGAVPQDAAERSILDRVLEFSQQNVELVTFCRDVVRGGLPTAIGFAQLDEPYVDVLERQSSETEVLGGIEVTIDSAEEMRRYLAHFVAQNPNHSSQLSLYTELLQFEEVRRRFDVLLAKR